MAFSIENLEDWGTVDSQRGRGGGREVTGDRLQV